MDSTYCCIFSWSCCCLVFRWHHSSCYSWIHTVSVSYSIIQIYFIFNWFFRLTRKHDRTYLATVVADCLKRFGLEKLVCFLFVCIFYPSWNNLAFSSSLFAWTMQAIMIDWQNIFLFLFHPFVGWLLVDDVFHILLISWQRWC